MKKKFSEFPTYNHVIQGIKNLEHVIWPVVSDFDENTSYIKAVEKILTKEFNILPNFIQRAPCTDFKLPIFRVRELSSFTNSNLFVEHSYPPIGLSDFGRCNLPKSPVFYCSNNPLISLMEVVRDNNYKSKKYCISKWEVLQSEEEYVFQTFLQKKLREDYSYDMFRKSVEERVNEPFENELNEDRKKGLLELLKYLHSSFIDDNSYAISSFLAHRSMYAPYNYSTDILMYPSIQTQFRGVNMAIHPNFVDNNMKIKRFYVAELENYDSVNGIFKVSISRYGIIDKSVILWKDLDPNDQEYKSLMDEDFKDFTLGKGEWNISKNNEKK
ncbi:MAG: hypothetical protein RJQ00_07185 [Vicingaceae bacterium]